jgi:hypothetical protein
MVDRRGSLDGEASCGVQTDRRLDVSPLRKVRLKNYVLFIMFQRSILQRSLNNLDL